MARPLSHYLLASPLPVWVWPVIVFLLFPFVCALMGKKHAAVKKKPAEVEEVGTSQGGESSKAAGKRKAPEESEASRKLSREAQTKAQKRWDASVEKRNIVCERQVDAGNLGRNEVVRCLIRHGLSYMFQPIHGYVRSFVVEFYKSLQVFDGKLEAKVGGKKIVVTADNVAEFFGNYKRPDPEDVTFPAEGGFKPVDVDQLVRDCYVDPTQYDGKLVVG